MQGIPLFAACSKDELEQIAGAASTLSFPAGTVLAAEGDAGHEFMVIAEGSAEVSVRAKVINRLGPDDFFGEVALLDGGPRTATVVAVSDVVAHVIEQREFAVLLFDSRSLARKILIGVAKRLRAAEVRLEESGRSTD